MKRVLKTNDPVIKLMRLSFWELFVVIDEEKTMEFQTFISFSSVLQ
jgi:hypothetical protein